ncbi:MAG: hypothetical protein LBT36_03145, partial [Oscillospiraceae bacterium]|nr:hypothetical protein [Oscillospiraceae bacterium]
MQTKHSKSKFLALALVLALALSLVPGVASAAHTTPPELAGAQFLGTWVSEMTVVDDSNNELDGWGIELGSLIWLCGDAFDSSTFSIAGYTRLDEGFNTNPLGGGMTPGTYCIFERYYNDDFFVILLEKTTYAPAAHTTPPELAGTRFLGVWDSFTGREYDELADMYMNNLVLRPGTQVYALWSITDNNDDPYVELDTPESIAGYTRVYDSADMTAGTYCDTRDEGWTNRNPYVLILDSDWTTNDPTDGYQKDSGALRGGGWVESNQNDIQYDLNRLGAVVGNGTATYTVSGSATGATESLILDIPKNITLVWNGEYTGSALSAGLITVSGAGVFEVGVEGKITANGNFAAAVYSNGPEVIVRGRVAANGEGAKGVASQSKVTVDGGKVTVSGKNAGGIEAPAVVVQGFPRYGFKFWACGVFASGENAFAVSSFTTPLTITGRTAIYSDSAEPVYGGIINAASDGGIIIRWDRTNYDANPTPYIAGTTTDIYVLAAPGLMDHGGGFITPNAKWIVDDYAEEDGNVYSPGITQGIGLDFGMEGTSFVNGAQVVAAEEEPEPSPDPAEGTSEWAYEEVSAAIEAGLVPEHLQKDYTLPVTRGEVAEMFISLIEQSLGKTIEAV